MLEQFTLQYQISPIILTRGSFGAGVSIVELLGGIPSDLNSSFAKFQPLPGGTLIEQTIGQYPFANQSIAANAVVRQPLTLSLIMITPQSQASSWSVKLSTMSALKSALDAHNNSGGTYTVMTPAYTYTDLVMIDLVDSSTADTVLPQNAWRWDFQKPLITLADAEAAQNSLTSKITAGLPTQGNLTGSDNPLNTISPNYGANTNSGSGGVPSMFQYPLDGNFSAYTGINPSSFNAALGEPSFVATPNFEGFGTNVVSAPQPNTAPEPSSGTFGQ